MLYQNIMFLFGLVTIAVSKNLNRDHAHFEVQDIQGLLKSLQEKGADIRHPKGSHQNHHGKPIHEDDHNLMNIQTLNLVFKHNNLRRDKPVNRNDDEKDNQVNRIMCAITGSYGCARSDTRDELRADTVTVHGKKHKKDDDDEYFDYDRMHFDIEAKNDIESLLNDLEDKLQTNKGKEGRGKDNRVKSVVRCRGNRCELHINDREDEDSRDQLRCRKKCRNFRANDGDEKEDLRCRGNRCDGWGRAGDDDNDKTRDDGGNGELRCGRCSRGRFDDNDDRRDDDIRDDDIRDDDRRDDDRRDDDRRDDDRRDDDRRDDDRRDDDRRDDDRRDDDRRDDDRRDDDRQGRSRSRNDDDIDSAFKSVLDNYGKRYKINNELDAIVLDVDNLDEVLEAFDDNKKKTQFDGDLVRHEKKRLAKDNQRERSYKQRSTNKKVLTLESLGDDNLLLLKGPLKLNKEKGDKARGRSLLPMTVQQKLRLVKQQSAGDKEKVQVPFVLEVQGLGQANAKSL